jgi:2-amino-4-hydroxy-6-hydroxymethyldihydropteridine diphosphokinase
MPTAYIALGSNLPSPAGTPRQTLEAAIESLADLGQIQAQSSFYETAPVGYANQPTFLNAAHALETTLDPEPLLDHLLQIERRFGRDRTHGILNGPRTLDLDLLLYDDRILDTPRLQLPHPRLAERAFVLIPLAEIAPNLMHPQLHQSMKQLLEKLTRV